MKTWETSIFFGDESLVGKRRPHIGFVIPQGRKCEGLRGQILIRYKGEQMVDAVKPCPPLVVGMYNIPG